MSDRSSKVLDGCVGPTDQGRPGPQYCAVVFDLDGTLIDTAFGIAEALNKTGLTARPVATDEVRDLVSGGAAHLIKETLNLQAADVAGGLQRFREIYATVPCGPEHLFAGVASALDRLQQAGLRLGVCTNKPQTLAERVLEQSGLAPYFPVVVGSAPCRPDKPDPAPLHLAAAQLCASRVVFVGDSMVDALTACAAGAPFVYAAFGYGEVAAEYCAAIAENGAALFPVLEQLLWPSNADNTHNRMTTVSNYSRTRPRPKGLR